MYATFENCQKYCGKNETFQQSTGMDRILELLSPHIYINRPTFVPSSDYNHR